MHKKDNKIIIALVMQRHFLVMVDISNYLMSSLRKYC